MQCPHCRLENPPSAERCDCGYDFAAGQLKGSYVEAHERRKGRSASVLSSSLSADVQDGATLYTRTMRLVALQVGLAVLRALLRRAWPRVPADPEALLTVFGLTIDAVMLFVAILLVVCTYRLAIWLKKRSPVLWAAGMLVPCLGLVLLLVLARETASELRREGLKVGLLRADPRDGSTGS